MFVLIPRVDPRNILASAERETTRMEATGQGEQKKGKKKERERENERKKRGKKKRKKKHSERKLIPVDVKY